MAKTTNTTETGTGRESRWRRWLLVASLGFNLLVLGLVAGAVIRGEPPSGRAPRFDLTVGPLTRALGDDDRQAIRDELQDRHPFDRDDRRAMRQDSVEMLDILRADSFDADAFREVLTRQRQRLALAQDAGIDQLILRIEAMTAEARVDFAERLTHEMRHMLRDRDRDRDD